MASRIRSAGAGFVGTLDRGTAIASSAGSVDSVLAWGSIAGQITAADGIGEVLSGGEVTATGLSGCTPVSNDRMFEGDAPVISSHGVSSTWAWLNGQYGQLLQGQAAAVAAGNAFGLANEAAVAGMFQGVPSGSSVSAAGTTAIDALFAENGFQIEGDLQVQGWAKDQAFAAAQDSYQDALANASLALAAANRTSAALAHQSAIALTAALTQSAAAQGALVSASQLMMTGRQADFQAFTQQQAANNGQRPAQWRQVAQSKVYSIALDAGKEVLNSVAIVLTFTPLAPLAPALMAGSAAISVVQGNYLEAGITMLCTLPMLKAPAAAAAESEASQSLGNLARRGESVAAEDAGLGLQKSAAGEVSAKCALPDGCFVAGTQVVVASSLGDDEAGSQRDQTASGSWLWSAIAVGVGFAGFVLLGRKRVRTIYFVFLSKEIVLTRFLVPPPPRATVGTRPRRWRKRSSSPPAMRPRRSSCRPC